MDTTRGRTRAPRRRWARLAAVGTLVLGLVTVGPGPVGGSTCAGAAPARAAQAAPVPYCERVYEVARTQAGTVYRTTTDADGNPVDLALDVWEPVGDPADEVRPVVLWMHGGYFAMGSREDNASTIADFASRGFVVVSISYRLRPMPSGGGFPVPSPEAVTDALEDAAAAVAWVHAEADALRIDRNAIVAAGYSAGGITALGLAHKDSIVSAPGSTTPIAAAVSFSGMDLHPPLPRRAGDPPVLMYNSDNDGTVPPNVAKNVCDQAAQAGSECDFVMLAGEGHTPGRAELYQQTVAWLAAHGFEQLAACDRFDPPPVVSTTTTTTSGPATPTTVPHPTSPPAPGAPAPAVPVRGAVAYTG